MDHLKGLAVPNFMTASTFMPVLTMLKIGCGLFVSSLAFAAPAALPTSIQLQYAVTKNGQPFANVKEQYQTTNQTYKIESVTKGIGVYALFGLRQLTSAGAVTEAGLKPAQFELHQGDNEKKSLVTTFDWAKNSLIMLVKGREKTADLVAGTQDLASYAYQWMFDKEALQNHAQKNKLEVDLTTGKKLNHYSYTISAANIEVLGKSISTLHLAPVKAENDKDSTETKELWLAADYYYLPVRILIVDENGQKLEQTLTEFNAK